MNPSLARAQIAAVARHSGASATERHFAAEMLRGPVTLEIGALVTKAVRRLLGVVQAVAAPSAVEHELPSWRGAGRIRLEMFRLDDALALPIRRSEPGVCHGCLWDWPVMECKRGRFHHALGSRRHHEVIECTRPEEPTP